MIAKLVKLDDVAPLIESGDVLLYRATGSVVSTFISRYGRGIYSHVAMAGFWDTDLMVLEVREFLGGRAVLLDRQVRENSGLIDVYRPDVTPSEKGQAFAAMRRKTGKSYNYRAVLRAMLYHTPFARFVVAPPLVDVPLDSPDYPEDCASAISNCFREFAGRDLVPNLADVATEPNDLARSSSLRYLMTLTACLVLWVTPVQAQLMSAEKSASLRKYFPTVDDPKIQAVLSDPNLILYTDEEMVPAYQKWPLAGDQGDRGSTAGVHAVSYNISGDSSEPFGNGNREFPWGAPAGLHKSPHSVFRFLLLPVVRGARLPVAVFRRILARDRVPAYCWIYPVGTVVGEVLIQYGPDGRGYAFEVRTRTRERGAWAVDAFRPFPTPEALQDRLAEIGYQQPVVFGRPVLRTLVDRHPRQSFNSVALVEELPSLPANVVAKLLTTTPFKSALGTSWRETSDHTAAAPTTSQPFHIVPPDYQAGFVPVDSNSCMRCHESTLKHVDDFQPARDWYGRIRGSDGIFSFHPFARESISHNGFGIPVRMNPRLEQAGVIEPYDAGRHPAALYHELDK